MWTFSRSTMEFAAPFATLATLAWWGLGVWRWSVHDAGGGLACVVFGGVTAVYAGVGWFLRSHPRSDDPWEPR